MRHRKGLGPYLSRQTTDGRLFEGNIGSGGSDEGIAGGDDDGNYDSPSDDPGRDSSRFNGGGGGGGGSDPTRRQQRRAIREGVPVSEIVDRETGGRSSFDPGEVTVDDPEFQQRRAIREFDTGGVQTDVDVSTPQAGRGTELGNADGSVAIDDVPVVGDAVNAVQDVGDFVRSGPDEASVGDPEFNDPGTVETEVPAQTGGNETVDPSRPLTGVDQELVNETTDSGGIVAERPGDSSALLPGEIGGFDISEQRLEEFAAEGERINERITPNGTAEVSAGPGNQLVADVGATTGNAVGNIVQGAAETPGVVESGVEFAQNAPISGESVQTAGSVAVGAAANMGQRAFNDPGLFAAELGVGAVTGTAATRVGLGAASRAPVSTRRVDFETDTGTTTARAIEIGTEQRNIRPVGTVDGRPRAGTPGVELDDVDFEAQGEALGPAFEPETRFEADVVETSLRNRGDIESANRVGAVSDLVDAGDDVDTGTVTREEFEAAVEDVQRIEGDAKTITDELARRETTVFGSGAIRTQVPDFRQPGDIDAVVPRNEIAQADANLRQFGDFDLKEPDDFAGLREGEVFGFGAESRSPVAVEGADGLRINPVGEELQRQAGASGFVRRGIFEAGEIDVGARPTPLGEPSPRSDVADAAQLAGDVLGEAADETQQFRRAFADELDEETQPLPPAAEPRQPGLFDEFVGEDRAQLGIPDRRGRPVADGRGRADVDVDETRPRDVDSQQRAADSDPSPVPRRDSPSPTRRGSASPSRVPQSGGVFGSVVSSPPSTRDIDGDIFGPPIGSSPPSRADGSSPPTTTAPSGSSPPGVSPSGGSSPPSFVPGVPSTPPSVVPGTPSSPPISPPIDVPSRTPSPPGQSPPSSPPSPPSPPSESPPSSPPATPTPDSPPSDPTRRRDLDVDIEEEPNDPLPLFGRPPETPLFENPVASGIGDLVDR